MSDDTPASTSGRSNKGAGPTLFATQAQNPAESSDPPIRSRASVILRAFALAVPVRSLWQIHALCMAPPSCCLAIHTACTRTSNLSCSLSVSLSPYQPLFSFFSYFPSIARLAGPSITCTPYDCPAFFDVNGIFQATDDWRQRSLPVVRSGCRGEGDGHRTCAQVHQRASRCD